MFCMSGLKHACCVLSFAWWSVNVCRLKAVCTAANLLQLQLNISICIRDGDIEGGPANLHVSAGISVA